MTSNVSRISPREVLIDRVVPHSHEAEMALLASMVLNNDNIGEVLERIEDECFYRPGHRLIFKAILDLYSSGTSCDLVTLKDKLAGSGHLERAGGIEYLAQLVETVPSAANFLHYAEIVRDRAILRSVIRTCERIIREARESGEDADRTLDHAQELIFQTATRGGKGSVTGIRDILKDCLARIEDIRKRNVRIQGLSSGFSELDDLISGFQPSQLYVMAGRPSMGKSSLAMRVIENVAVELNRPVLFFSLEMAAPQIAEQMACSFSRVSSHKLRTGMLAEEDYRRLVFKAGALGEAPIFIDDSADLTDLEMRARARRFRAQQGVELVVVDYLQKMHVRGAENRLQEISRLSSSLKSLAKELSVPVIALAQLNRAAEGREDRRPMLADLRESGSIEQDADVVMLLYRDEYYHPDTDRKNMCDICVAKNRTGPTDTIELVFLKDLTRFENPATARMSA